MRCEGGRNETGSKASISRLVNTQQFNGEHIGMCIEWVFTLFNFVIPFGYIITNA